MDMRIGFPIRGLAAAFVCAVNLHPSCALAQGGAREFREVHLGMEVRIVIASPVPDAAAVAARAFGRVEELEAILSDWRPTSELRALERARPGQWVPVSTPLRDVLALALDVARATDGAFDPTVGPLTALWREAQRTGVPVADSARASARRRVGYAFVELDSARSRVRFARAGVRLDLGAVAKGWILDDVLARLRGEGVTDALVEAGGDLVVTGAPPGADGWRVAVPRAGGDTVLVLRSGAVSTSGPDAQRIGGADGAPESHVFDARTGRGSSAPGSITVVGARAAVSDALATALSVVRSDLRAGLAERYGVRIITP